MPRRDHRRHQRDATLVGHRMGLPRPGFETDVVVGDVRPALDDRFVVLQDRVVVAVTDHDPSEIGAFLFE